MGYIKEPKNVDLVVGPSVLTDKDIQTISDAIAEYHKTGKHSSNIDEMPQRLYLKRSAAESLSRKKTAKV
jgi:hypothetical protein